MRYIAAMMLFAFLFAATVSTYTYQSANIILNQTSAYITKVNQSAYLFFYPNLKSSYGYLSEAYNSLNTSPDKAVAYANLATTAAQNAYAKISMYRLYSLIAAVAFTVIMAAVLYALMSPPKKARRSSRKT